MLAPPGCLREYRSDSREALSCDDREIRENFEALGAWGLATGIDFHFCSADIIRSAYAIDKLTIALCEHIKMKRFEECHVVDFGEDEEVAGYSMFQLIETSNVSAHFANKTNTTYFDVFSCKYYNPFQAANFLMKQLGANDYVIRYAAPRK